MGETAFGLGVVLSMSARQDRAVTGMMQRVVCGVCGQPMIALLTEDNAWNCSSCDLTDRFDPPHAAPEVDRLRAQLEEARREIAYLQQLVDAYRSRMGV